jgi:hypothetical protein
MEEKELKITSMAQKLEERKMDVRPVNNFNFWLRSVVEERGPLVYIYDKVLPKIFRSETRKRQSVH